MKKIEIKVEDLVVGQFVLLASAEFELEYVGIDHSDNRIAFRPAGKTSINEFGISNFNGEGCFCFDIDLVKHAGLKEVIHDEEFFDITYNAVMAAIHTVIRS